MLRFVQVQEVQLLWLYSLMLGIGLFFSFLVLYTVGGTSCTGHRPIPTHRTTETDIRASSWIRTHGRELLLSTWYGRWLDSNPDVLADEDNWCRRPHGHCDRPWSARSTVQNTQHSCWSLSNSCFQISISCVKLFLIVGAGFVVGVLMTWEMFRYRQIPFNLSLLGYSTTPHRFIP
jgi:hypothetical protein